MTQPALFPKPRPVPTGSHQTGTGQTGPHNGQHGDRFPTSNNREPVPVPAPVPTGSHPEPVPVPVPIGEPVPVKDANITGTSRRRPEHPAKHLAAGGPDGILARYCRTCRGPIITGLDAPTLAIQARADPTPLNPLGEALARLAGLQTYELRPHGQGHARLQRRNPDAITSRPAGGPRAMFGPYDVLAAHQCGRPHPDPTRAPAHLLAPPAQEAPDDDDPDAPPPF